MASLIICGYSRDKWFSITAMNASIRTHTLFWHELNQKIDLCVRDFMPSLTHIPQTHIKNLWFYLVSCFSESSVTERQQTVKTRPWTAGELCWQNERGEEKRKRAGRAACGCEGWESEKDRRRGAVNSAIPLTQWVQTPTEHEWVCVCVLRVTARDLESNICQVDLPAHASLTSFVCQWGVQGDRWRKGAGLNRMG